MITLLHRTISLPFGIISHIAVKGQKTIRKLIQRLKTWSIINICGIFHLIFSNWAGHRDQIRANMSQFCLCKRGFWVWFILDVNLKTDFVSWFSYHSHSDLGSVYLLCSYAYRYWINVSFSCFLKNYNSSQKSHDLL